MVGWKGHVSRFTSEKNLDRKGVSEAGTKKMDEQKMQTRSTKTFNEWPYIMGEVKNA